MAYQIPWSNFHELNLDWLLQQVKQLRQDVDNITGGATPSTTIPEMDGLGSPGTEDNYSRGDHRHPTDTSRAAQADLAQEVIDRGNADNTLQTNINTVDAKIKFSAASPLMDSSSASAGFSDFIARADHIHPTDTSRASQTDLASLTARVDAFSGSASPSDATPLMDGVGTPGDVGSYSRGNHQHPSDNSKLDKAGGTITGNLILQGNLTETQRRQYINVNSIGWLRSIQAPMLDGTRIDIVVARKGTVAPSEVHKVTFVYNQSGPAFLDEQSAGDVCYIDKIRFTDAGRIDIHMDQTAESQICVYIDAAAPTVPAIMNIRALEIEGVADAPAGETILTTYTFTTERLSLSNKSIIRKLQSYPSVTLAYDDSYTLLDSYSNMNINSSLHCLGFTIKGWSGFPYYGINILRSTSGTDFYFTGVKAGTYGPFSVEYWFIDLP